MTVAEAWNQLSSAINTVVGCAMFAPDEMRKRDLPGLIDAMRDAEEAMQQALEAEEGLL